MKAGEVDTDVMRAKLHALSVLGYEVNSLEDVLVTLTAEYHLIYPVNRREIQGVFIYLVLDRNRAALAIARAKLRELGDRLDV